MSKSSTSNKIPRKSKPDKPRKDFPLYAHASGRWAKNGEIFQTTELLPGDEVWFKNPYFGRLSRSLQRRYVGQEGHHVFYIGGGKVMDMYSREPLFVEEFRKTFLRWKSVRIVAEQEQCKPKAADFQIKAVRRVIVDKA